MRRHFLARAVAAVLLASNVAHAQHVHDEAAADMAIGSTRAGRGALAIAFDWTTPVRATFSDALGSLVLHSALDPGFAPATDDALGVHPLRPGTEVHVVLVDDAAGGGALKVRDVVLAAPGDRAVLGMAGDAKSGSLHHHPEFQLRSRASDGAFAEATVAFRLEAPASAYRPSPVYVLSISNGHLPPLTYATASYDVGALRCQQALAGGVAAWLRTLVRSAAHCPSAFAPACAAGTACTDAAGASATPDAIRAALAPERAALLARLDDACVAVADRGWDARARAAHVGLGECRLASTLAQADRAGEPACPTDVARRLGAFFVERSAAVRPCLLRVNAGLARAEAGLLVSNRLVQATCAGVGADDGHMIERVTRARRRAARALRRRCGPGAAAAALTVASCAADDLLSATWASARADLEAFTSRPRQGGLPLASYFPCLRGGTAHTHTHDHGSGE